MVRKIKTKKGFIQIPLLIAIIISIVVVSVITTGVVLHKQGKLEPLVAGISQIFKRTEKIKTEEAKPEPEQVSESPEGVVTPESFTPPDEETQKRVTELEQRIKELEKEKQKQSLEQALPLTPKDEGKLPQDLLNELMRRTVKITCTGLIEGLLNISGGSGFIFKDGFIFTNAHVIVPGEVWTITCYIEQPLPPNYYPSNPYATKYIMIGKEAPDIDFGVLLIPSGTPGFGKLSDFIPDCKQSNVEIGDSVKLFGYPNFGGESLTVTEGIISGFEQTKYGVFYKTSAKIDSGNSGGIAVDASKKCVLGIPTLAKKGTFEGLAYIQSWEIINKANMVAIGLPDELSQ